LNYYRPEVFKLGVKGDVKEVFAYIGDALLDVTSRLDEKDRDKQLENICMHPKTLHA
jgi:hypothetical protein